MLTDAERNELVVTTAGMLVEYFDNAVMDAVNEALYRQGIDTLEDERAQDEAASIAVEAIDEMLVQLGYEGVQGLEVKRAERAERGDPELDPKLKLELTNPEYTPRASRR